MKYSGTWLVQTPMGHAMQVSLLSGCLYQAVSQEKNFTGTCIDIKTKADKEEEG